MRTNKITVTVLASDYGFSNEDSTRLIELISAYEGDRLTGTCHQTTKSVKAEWTVKREKEVSIKGNVLAWFASASDYFINWAVWPEMPNSIDKNIRELVKPVVKPTA